jgi:eukaryotic-like serine/threonine-protein kinase
MTDAIERLTSALSDRYRIDRELGQGGMATVYLAHDVRHDRKVALKLLRPELAAILGADRFLAEIKTTANLQHPHILSLFDSGEADGLVFYVMPYVEGESLRDRLKREHQLPVDEAIRITREVADALDYAHRHKVIHRDIKPENILLHDGRALVADFGIALAVSRSDGGTRMTETGMSLGTPHYMAPEQAMGEKEITPKADVYALGCVLYEMLAGEPPFTGPTAQAIIARVVTDEPRSLTLQRKTIPPHLDAAVVRSLEKLPADRFATAADFAAALANPAFTAGRGKTGAVARSARPARVTAALPWAGGILALGVGLAFGAGVLAPSAPARVLRMSLTLPGEAPPVALRLSPDGQTLAYITGQGDRLAIFTRRLDELQSRRLEGTEDAVSISFSPDGEWIAFLGGSQARKVPIGGGTPVPILVQGNAAVNWIEWAGDERFVVNAGPSLAMLEPDGSLHPFAAPDTARGESGLTLTQVLPDGRVLASVWRGTPAGPMVIVDPASGRRDTLLRADVTWAAYADGMLAWTLQDGVLNGAALDLGKRRLTGPTRVLGGTVLSILGFAPPATLGSGGLAYAPTRPRALVRVARTGLASMLLATDRTYHNPRVSPDGRRVSLDFTDQVRDVWIFDIGDSTLTRFGFDSSAHDAEWLPDGRGVLFSATRGGAVGVFRRQLDASGRADSIRVGPVQISVHAVTPDGRTGIGVAYDAAGPDGNLVVLGLADRSRYDTLLATRAAEGWPALSPDGRWLAYQSDESGRSEVYVRSWPAFGSKVQVSQSGGSEPAWSRDGRELFYRSGGGSEPMLLAAAVETGAQLRVRSRTSLFNVASYEFSVPHRNYDPFPDGRTFAMVRQGQPGQLAEVVYVQNPHALLKQGR